MKLLVIDDHPLMRAGIAASLAQLGPETVVLQAGEATQALELAAAHPDLDAIILDLALPGMDGMRAIGELSRVRPNVPVIVVSASEEVRDVREALANGALGYVPKSAGQRTLLSAVRLVLEGERYLPGFILDGPIPAAGDAPADRRPRRTTFTDRQVEVLRLICQGQSNKSIASDLGLSEKTIKAHISAIFRALDVVNRTQAAAAARNEGLI